MNYYLLGTNKVNTCLLLYNCMVIIVGELGAQFKAGSSDQRLTDVVEGNLESIFFYNATGCVPYYNIIPFMFRLHGYGSIRYSRCVLTSRTTFRQSP